MNQQQGSVVAIVVLLVFQLASVGLPPTVDLTDDDQPQPVGTSTVQQFSDGSSSFTSSVGGSITPTVPVEYGYSMTNGQVDLQFSGSPSTSTTVYSVASGMLNGTFNGTVSDGMSVELMSASAGPPQAGTNSTTVLNSTTMSGTHSYNTLELLCGFASCGRIVATGDLTLYVNVLRVEQGTSIEANALVTGGTGAGTGTTTPSNGRNDGGGGAGHGGAGGDGGGTNGGAGGSSYGNGSERGSQGGSVSSSYHSAANGGNGGGYIRIFANQIYVNGSIHANGEDGDGGSQATQGTGPGGSGAGGGSGGSIQLSANSVNVGNGGQIKADGGDGGDGANGAQNGPGFGMYDGGDGGGGGAGGRIVIKTQSGGYSNSGTVQAVGGNGGSKGLKYGTGIDGIDGNGGSNGVVTASTWAGYLASSNLTANNGTFVTQPVQTQTQQPSTAHITHAATVPSTGSLTVAYRTTLNGSDASWEEWSDWQPLSLSGEVVGRHAWLQLAYTFSRTGTTSPSLTAFEVTVTHTPSLHYPALLYDGQATVPDISGLTLGHTASVNDTSTASQPQFSFDVPVGATFHDNLSVWMQWPAADASVSFTEASIGGTTVLAQQLNHTPEGVDLLIDASALNALSPATTWTDTNGVAWHRISVDVTMSGSTAPWFAHGDARWDYAVTLNLTDAVNDVILYECGTFYAFTSMSCFGASSSHRFTVQGTTVPPGGPVFDVEFSNPMFDWVDEYAPVVTSIEHRQGVEQMPDLRVLNSYSVVLFDDAGEDDLDVQFLGLDWVESDGLTQAVDLQYHNGLQGYYIYLDANGFELQLEHHVNLTFRVSDSNGNEILPYPVYNLTIYPVAPSISDVQINGPTLLSTLEERSVWDIDGAKLTFVLEESNLRDSLDVRMNMVRVGTTQPLEVPMVWEMEKQHYTMTWVPERRDMGEWTVEFVVSEFDGLQETVEDGWRTGMDAVIVLTDAQGPLLLDAVHPASIEAGDAFSVDVSWAGSNDEVYHGSIAVVQDGVEVQNKSIVSTPNTNVSLVFDTQDLIPGQYSLHIHLEDDEGNVAGNPWLTWPTFTVLEPLIVWNGLLSVVNFTTLSLVGEVNSRSGNVSVDVREYSNGWNDTQILEEGPIALNFSVGLPTAEEHLYAVTVCDAAAMEACTSSTFALDFSEAFAIQTTNQCTVFLVNESSSAEQTLLQCTVTNQGATSVVASFTLDNAEHLTVEEANVEPDQTSSLQLILTNGTEAVNHTAAWTLKVTNLINERRVLEMGQLEIQRNPPSQNNSSTQTEDETEGSATLLLGGVGLIILVIAGSMLFYRSSRNGVEHETEQAVSKDWTNLEGEITRETPMEVESSQVDGHEVVGGEPVKDWPQATFQESIADAPGGENVPPVNATPTSVDEHGYEWYSTPNGHWYRTAGSQSPWLAYEQ